MENQVMLERVPALYTQEASARMSEKYLKINTARIIETMQANGFTVSAASQARTIKPEKRLFARHIVKFRFNPLINREDSVPEIALMNSHDGTSAYKMLFGIHVRACANGLFVADNLVPAITIRHIGRHDVLNSIMASAESMAKQAALVSSVIDSWKAQQLSQDQKVEYAKGAIDLYRDGADIKIRPDSALLCRRYEDRQDNLWSIFNRVQENFIRGGIYTQNAAGQYRRARAVNNIDRNVNLNRALWEYTAKFNQN